MISNIWFLILFLERGPARFGSSLSVDDATPLARRYILPIMDERRRYFMSAGATGFRTGGRNWCGHNQIFHFDGRIWLGGYSCIFLFLGVGGASTIKEIISGVIQHALVWHQLALACCLMFLAMIMMFVTPVTMPVLSFTIWAFVGRVWDMKPTARPEAGAETLLPEGV